MSEPRVFIVIPVHNRKASTLRCLASLRRQTYESRTVIVVDSGSIDGTAEDIKAMFPSTVVLSANQNVWWTGATNLGVRFALDSSSSGEDFILTLNNDVVLGPDYLVGMVNSASAHPNSLIGTVALSAQDRSTIVDGGTRLNWITAKYTRLHREQKYQSMNLSSSCLQQVDVLPGRGTILPISVFRQIGLFDERRLPHYGADYEFSCRARKRGYNLYVDYRLTLLSDTRSTGLNNELVSITWEQLLKSFFSIKSPNSIRYRWNFARLTCPKILLPTFFLLDTTRVFLGALRNQIKPHTIVTFEK